MSACLTSMVPSLSILKIDATGIQRDMKKVERAARGAGDATESIGSGFRTAERDADRAASGIQGGTRKVERAARSAGSEVEDIGSSFRDAERDAGRAARGIEDDLKDLKDSVDDVSNAISLGFGADMLVDLAGGMMDLMESTDELRGDLSMLDQNARAAGVGLGTTREAMQKLNTVSGETDSSIDGSIKPPGRWCAGEPASRGGGGAGKRGYHLPGYCENRIPCGQLTGDVGDRRGDRAVCRSA